MSPGRTLARFNTAPTPVSTPQPIRQAEVSGTSLGMRTACTSLTTVTSEKTDEAAKFEAGSPLKVKGVVMLPSELLHHDGCPVLQARQTPQLASVAMTTWSPGLTEVTEDPTASTTPAPSCPITSGAGKGMVPSMTERSEWHTPAACMRTWTSLGPGARTSSSSVTSTADPV